MKINLTNDDVCDLYSRTGDQEFKKCPIGVWCLIEDRNKLKLVRRQDWNHNHSVAIGVVIITNTTAFVIAPHNTIYAHWSPVDTGNDSVRLITDKESLDAAQATDRIVEKYSGVLHVDSNGETQYNFIGAPAADYCRNYSRGCIKAGKWHLPTVAQLKIIADNIAEVNACFLTMGLPPMSIGWYWSSISWEDDFRFAWVVYVCNGDAYYSRKDHCSCLRAVHPFDISDVCFTHPSSAE